MEKIEIQNYNSAGIKAAAQENSITHMSYLGEGHQDGNTNNPNSLVTFFQLDGGGRVADTNGDPVWEDGSESDFADLAEACGVEL
jgi:hypothetical protein